MALFEKALEAKVMSTQLLIRANVDKKTLLEAYGVAKAFEARYSAYKNDNFLSSINAAAGSHKVTCKSEDIALFRRAIEASKLSDGAFDITIGALSHGVYHYGFSNEAKGNKRHIDEAVKRVDYKKILLDERSIFLPQKGMRLDLGGIGKGYVAKRIAQFLQKSGAKYYLVDVGGEIITHGKRYSIAIKHPTAKGNIAQLQTSKTQLSISTSGSYERYIDEKNHHILHVKEGESRNDFTSMTLMQNGESIDMLDAMATAFFNSTKAYIQTKAKTLGISVIAIDKSGSITLDNLDELDYKSLVF